MNIFEVSFSLGRYHEELHVLLSPAESDDPMEVSSELLQYFWEHQLELQNQRDQLDQ
jgi:hypothetical protein